MERHQGTAVWSLGICTTGGCSFFMFLYLSQLLWCERVLLITSTNLTFYEREQSLSKQVQGESCAVLPSICVSVWTRVGLETSPPLGLPFPSTLSFLPFPEQRPLLFSRSFPAFQPSI